MISFDKNKIENLDKIYRLNLINSCTGYKSANLIGSVDMNGNTNLAIFSSITHLGSDPAMIGFVLRPRTVPRNTYNNLFTTKFFTVNHVKSDDIEDAHHTSAKYPKEISEFDKTKFEAEYLDGFIAPYVKGSRRVSQLRHTMSVSVIVGRLIARPPAECPSRGRRITGARIVFYPLGTACHARS